MDIRTRCDDDLETGWFGGKSGLTRPGREERGLISMERVSLCE